MLLNFFKDSEVLAAFAMEDCALAVSEENGLEKLLRRTQGCFAVLLSIAITLEFTVPSVLDSFPADSLSTEETDSDATAENVLFISS